MAEPNKKTPATPAQKPKTDTLDCPQKCWIEIEIRDELNGEIGSITGTIQDKCGEKWNPPRPIALGPGKNLIEGLVCGPVILAFKRETLVQTALALPMRDFGTHSDVPKYAGEVLGYNKVKCQYKMVTYNDLMDQNDANYPPGTSPCKFVTKASYVLELRALREEIIAIAGTQNKSGSNSRLMFSGQAIRFLRKSLGLATPMTGTNAPTPITNRLEKGALPPGAAKVSFIFFTDNYSPAEVALTEAAASKINNDLSALLAEKAPSVDFIKANSFERFQEYLGSSRERYLIKQINIYCHGEPGIIGLGYEVNDSFNITSSTLSNLPAYAFSFKAQLESYACRTGMGKNAQTKKEPYDDKRESSLAQQLADHLKISVLAYIRKSEYKDTWGSNDQRGHYYWCTESSIEELSQVGRAASVFFEEGKSKEWCAEYHEGHLERMETNEERGATFNLQGAYNDVSVSQDSFLMFTADQVQFTAK